jgi:hypothetical protein
MISIFQKGISPKMILPEKRRKTQKNGNRGEVEKKNQKIFSLVWSQIFLPSSVSVAPPFLFIQLLFCWLFRLFLSRDKVINIFAVDVCPAQLGVPDYGHGNSNGFCDFLFGCPL